MWPLQEIAQNHSEYINDNFLKPALAGEMNDQWKELGAVCLVPMLLLIGGMKVLISSQPKKKECIPSMKKMMQGNDFVKHINDEIAASPEKKVGSMSNGSFLFASMVWMGVMLVIWTPALVFISFPFVCMAMPQLWTMTTGGVWSALALYIGFLGLRKIRFMAAQPVATKGDDKVKKVCVIGAGAVGLAAVKECKEQGMEVTCFEMRPSIGGVFLYTPDYSGGCWPTTTLTSSPFVTAYSDFPPQSDRSKQWSHEEYIAYLQSYASHFGLHESLNFKHRVLNVAKKAGDKWDVQVKNETTGKTMMDTYDAVVVCAGVHLTPKLLDIPGMDTFPGTIEHVAEYKGPEKFAGKRVTIVGIGESAADISAELSKSPTKKTVLSVRRGKFIVPRINPRTGVANDYDTNRLRYSTPVLVRDSFMAVRKSVCSMGGSTADSRLRAIFVEHSGAGALSQPATKSDDFIQPLLDGRLEMKPNVAKIDGNKVYYCDGTMEEMDNILLAHGYRHAFPFLKLPNDMTHPHPFEMYLNMFIPEMGHTIAFPGYARPSIGSIPTVGEVQVRYLSLLLAGKLELPSADTMHMDIKKSQMRNSRAFPAAVRPNFVVEWIPYMDKVAGLGGFRPNAAKLLLSPWLLWKVAAGAMTGACYRLHGPGAKYDIASSTLRRLPRKHELDELLTHMILHVYAAILAPFFGKDFQSPNEVL